MRLASAAALLPLTLLTGTRPPGRALQAYDVDPGASRIWVVTHRAGLLSFLGHDHALVPGDWSARLCLAAPVPAGAHGSLVIRTASLVIDSDSARSLAGLGGGPSPGQVSAIQARTLDEAHLAADRYPEIRVAAAALEDETAGRLRMRAAITLRGVTKAVEFPLAVESAGANALRLVGAATFRQRDFGIEPESRAGVVKVADDVDLHFALLARPAGRPCDPAGPPD
jgi:polyisoprenoid-binding protein YceI